MKKKRGRGKASMFCGGKGKRSASKKGGGPTQKEKNTYYEGKRERGLLINGKE